MGYINGGTAGICLFEIKKKKKRTELTVLHEGIFIVDLSHGQ